MTKKVKISFTTTGFPYDVSYSSNYDGPYTLYASGITDDHITIGENWTDTTISSFTGKTMYIKVSCPNCNTEIFPLKLIPDSIVITGYTTNVTCPDNDDGSLTYHDNGTVNLYMGGGLPHPTTGYSYSWVGSAGGIVPAGQEHYKNLTGLTGGNYTVTATDYYGLSSTATFTVPERSLFVVNPTLVNPTCYGGSDGSITLLYSGGAYSGVALPNPPYIYTWKKNGDTIVGASGNTLTNIGEGTYTSHVQISGTDCFDEQSHIISNPLPCNPPTGLSVLLYNDAPTPPTATPTPTPTVTPTPTPTTPLVACGGTISDSYTPTGNVIQKHGMNLTGAANGSTVTIHYTANSRPDRFNIYDNSHNLVYTTGWVGSDYNYTGPWTFGGGITDTDGDGYFSFTYNSSKTYELWVDVGPANPSNPLSDSWSATISCEPPLGEPARVDWALYQYAGARIVVSDVNSSELLNETSTNASTRTGTIYVPTNKLPYTVTVYWNTGSGNVVHYGICDIGNTSVYLETSGGIDTLTQSESTLLSPTPNHILVNVKGQNQPPPMCPV
jgi:hypothetical protein